jgi:hypothetical protein
MTNSALSPRDETVLRFLRAELKANRIAPAQWKVAVALGRSPSSTDHVRAAYAALELAGYIRRMSAQGWRCIKLVEPEDDDAADRARRLCADPSYLAQLKLVQALPVSPKIGLAHRLKGLAPLSESTKRNWLEGFPLQDRSAA